MSNEGLLDVIRECGETARSKGFWDVHREKARALLRKRFGLLDENATGVVRFPAAREMVEQDETEFTIDAALLEQIVDIACDELVEHFLLGDPVIFMALMASEIGEAIEAYRHGTHVGKDSVSEELADVGIRIFDFVARFGPRLGFEPEDWIGIMKRKMEYNSRRPALHGKKF